MQVGVIIPNHNYGHWVTGAIESVFNQTKLPKKIIIIDDGSTDNSLDILSTYFNTDFNINETTGKAKLSVLRNSVDVVVAHWKKAQGPSYARNYAIGMMSQDEEIEAYAFLDSDDIYQDRYIEQTTKLMSTDINIIGVVYTDSYIYEVRECAMYKRYWEPFDRAKLVDGNRLSMNSLVNRKAIDTCGMFDPELRTLEDWDLWLRISERFVLLHLPKFLVTQRNHGNNSLSVVSKEKWSENWDKVMKKAVMRMQNG